VRGVDLEMPAKCDTGIGAAEPVGSEHSERRRDETRNLIGDRLQEVGDRGLSDRGRLSARVSHGHAWRALWMEPVPALDL